MKSFIEKWVSDTGESRSATFESCYTDTNYSIDMGNKGIGRILESFTDYRLAYYLCTTGN